MPGGDGTGPMGMGSMTGRGMGYCAGYAAPGYANAGFGMGRGRGFRRMYYRTGMPGWARGGAFGFAPYNGAVPYGVAPYGVAPYGYPGNTPEVDEKEALQNQVDFLEKQLEEMRERLKGFEKAK